MRKFTIKEQQEILAVIALKKTTSGPACEPIGKYLVAKAKKLFPFYAGLSGPHKTSDKRWYSLASRHHPAQTCWSWSLTVSYPSISRSVNLKNWINWRKKYGHRSFLIPFIADFTFREQPEYAYMVSGYAIRLLVEACSEATALKIEQLKEQEKWSAA